jgi:hypothetical protein
MHTLTHIAEKLREKVHHVRNAIPAPAHTNKNAEREREREFIGSNLLM